MRYRSLGSTGFKVSEIGFGAWAIGGAWWGPQDDEDSRLALHKALDMGCNFIDTAAVYGDGHSERLIGGVLKERGEHPVVATKVPPKNWQWDNKPGTSLEQAFPPDWVCASVEKSLGNLGLDCLDVLQLHTWMGEWNSQAEPLLEGIAKLKKEGKIRAFGISLRDKGPEEANDLIRWRQVDTLQVFFNLLYQDPLWKLFPLAKQYGTGIIARVPMAFGALTGKFTAHTRFVGDDHRRNLYMGENLKTTLLKLDKLKFLKNASRPLAEAALKWTLAYPEVSTSIPGIRNLRQADLNCAAGVGPVLKNAEVKKAEKLYLKNFGLPVKKVSSLDGIHAVLLSGFKLDSPKAPKGKASRPPRKKTAGKKVKKHVRKKKSRPAKKNKK